MNRPQSRRHNEARAQPLDDWISKIPRSEFASVIREVFDFLSQEFAFGLPDIEETPLTLRVSYRAKTVAIEVDVDFRDLAVEVALVWLLHGKKPDGWKIDSTGRLFMARLYEAAWQRKLPNPHVTLPPNASPRDRLHLSLQAWADQLRTQFPDVLADKDEFFKELNGQQR